MYVHVYVITLLFLTRAKTTEKCLLVPKVYDDNDGKMDQALNISKSS